MPAYEETLNVTCAVILSGNIAEGVVANVSDDGWVTVTGMTGGVGVLVIWRNDGVT